MGYELHHWGCCLTHAISWSELRKVLDPLRPAPAALYVPPPRSVVEDIAEDITASPETHAKVLLVGPSGGGKSSELWAIRRAIGDRRICVDAALGEVEDALRALAGFLDAAGGVAGVAELAAGSPALVGGGSKALAGVLRLFTDRPALVSESSPWGGELQTAVHDIHEALVKTHDHRAVCLLIDGMEKMNGASAAKFREVFETTRLLLNLPCAAVFAAPACTLTESNAAAAHGWSPRPIYAFTGKPVALVGLLERRIEHVGLRPASIVPTEGLARLAAAPAATGTRSATVSARPSSANPAPVSSPPWERRARRSCGGWSSWPASRGWTRARCSSPAGTRGAPPAARSSRRGSCARA